MKRKASKRKTGRRKTQGKNRRHKVQRQVKDRLFRFLFEKDREALLALYNALNGTNYTDVNALQVVTIESAVYIVMKNDLAFVLAGVLNLYEHQSTQSPNLPVRFLIYLAQEYQKLIEMVDISLYGTRQITLPTPRCVVFYNGDAKAPEEQYLHLSDAFEDQRQTADVDLRVRVLNINHGHNQELMEKCRILREYAEFVEITKIYTARYVDRTEALNRAIDDCIKKNILAEFLRTYRAEVLGMLLEEFDAKKYERSIREEGREEGRAEGREEGAYQKLVLIISKKKSKGYTVKETADMLEEDIELVCRIYSALEEYDAEKEWDRIAEVIKK